MMGLGVGIMSGGQPAASATPHLKEGRKEGRQQPMNESMNESINQPKREFHLDKSMVGRNPGMWSSELYVATGSGLHRVSPKSPPSPPSFPSPSPFVGSP